MGSLARAAPPAARAAASANTHTLRYIVLPPKRVPKVSFRAATVRERCSLHPLPDGRGLTSHLEFHDTGGRQSGETCLKLNRSSLLLFRGGGRGRASFALDGPGGGVRGA